MSKKNKVREETKKTTLEKTINFYDKNYKKLLIIPAIFFLIALISIGFTYQKTGDFFIKDISLKGGSSLSVKTDTKIDTKEIEEYLLTTIPNEEFNVRALEFEGKFSGFVIDTTLKISDSIKLLSSIEKQFGVSLEIKSTNDVGSVLGESFFKELSLTLLFAFVLMGIIVFLYFRSLVPSAIVIISVIFDMVMTLGIINLLGVQISTAGIAAFLMLIGYSVDTDILLTSKVLKRVPGTPVLESILAAMKTGLTMSVAGLTATTIAFVLSNSIVIKQIMLILIIGLIIDLITTWLQNTGLLRWYLERKK